MNKKASILTQAVENLLEARHLQMITAEEWDAVASAFQQETGNFIQWRTDDEMPDNVHNASKKLAFTRQDYIVIVNVLRQQLLSHSGGGADAIVDVAEALAALFAKDNSNFNYDHFMSVLQGTKSLTSHPPRPKPPQRSLPNPADIKLPEKHESLNAPTPAINPATGVLPAMMGARRPRLAGVKVAVDTAYLEKAKELIDADDPVIYDVAANADPPQIVGNVKHMSWFIHEVAEWLEEEAGLDVEQEQPHPQGWAEPPMNTQG